ncbi:MAG TPA: hypothetical protein VII00_06710 [bacterium]
MPLYGDSITQGEWAKRLVKTIGLEEKGIPENATVNDYISLLQGGKNTQIEITAGSKNRNTVNLPLTLQHSGIYTLVIETNIKSIMIGIDDTVRQISNGQENSGRLNGGRFVLKRGEHVLSAVLNENEKINSINVIAPCMPKVEPLGGWEQEKLLTFTDKAVTIIKILNMEDRLPMHESFTFEIKSKKDLNEFLLQDAGIYTIYAQAKSSVDAEWEIDGCWYMSFISASTNNIPIWKEIGTLPFKKGKHTLLLKTTKGEINNKILLVKRDTNAMHYMNLLKKLNPIEGEINSTVSEEAAVANLLNPIFATRKSKGPDAFFYIDEEEIPKLPSEKELPPYTQPISPILPSGI